MVFQNFLYIYSVPSFIVLKKKPQSVLGGKLWINEKEKKVRKEKLYHLALRKRTVTASFQDHYADKTGKCVYPTLRLAVPPVTDWVSEHITETVL